MNDGVFDRTKRATIVSKLTVIHNITWLHDNFVQTICMIVYLINRNKGQDNVDFPVE